MTLNLEKERYRFGRFCLDVTALELTSGELRVPLTGKPLQMLIHLVRHRERVVTKRELYEAIWRHEWDTSLGTAVEAALAPVRSALKDDPKEPRYIRTIWGQGVRFIADVALFSPGLEVPSQSLAGKHSACKLIARGWHSWRLRTPDGFSLAASCFERASNLDPESPRAMEGLAVTHLTPGIYGVEYPSRALIRFRAASRRAVELGGWTDLLRTCHAHALHLFQGRVAEAQSILSQCLEGDAAIQAHTALAVLYIGGAEWQAARAALGEVLNLDELWPTLPALRSLLELLAGSFEAAVSAGREAVELHPQLPLSRVCLSQALDLSGHAAEALREMRLACALWPDLPLLQLLLVRCLARGGHPAEADSTLQSVILRGGSAYADPYYLGLAAEAVGNRELTYSSLEKAFEIGSTALFMLNVDPRWNRIRGEERFRAITSENRDRS